MEKWPFFSEKEVIVGNQNASVGVCTLWSPREKFVKKYLTNGKFGDFINSIALVGNLYSIFGIGILIRNYLASPHLKYLIVSGTEMGKAKAALESLSKDSSLARKLFLEEWHIRRFLKQVRIIFVKPQRIEDAMGECWLGKHHNKIGNMILEEFDPIIVPLPKPDVKVFPAAGSGHLIRVSTIAEGYEALLCEIRLFGHITGEDSEGHRRQELWQLTMVITNQNPLDFASIPHPEYDEEKIKKYCEDFWNGSEPKDLSYRYGHIATFNK